VFAFQALAKQTSELSRVGALEALATLSLTFGGQLGSSIPESVSIAAKQCYRWQRCSVSDASTALRFSSHMQEATQATCVDQPTIMNEVIASGDTLTTPHRPVAGASPASRLQR
jgi:hypothetical protein